MAILSFPKNRLSLPKPLFPGDAPVANAPFGPLEPLGATPQATGSANLGRASATTLLAASVIGASVLATAFPLAAQIPAPSAAPGNQPTQPTVPAGASPAATVAAQKLVTRPAAPAEWTVTFKYGSTVTPEQAAHRPNMVKVMLLGKEALETVHYPERTTEVWRAEGHVFVSEAGSDQATIRGEQALENVGGLGAGADQGADVTRGKNGQYTATVSGVTITGSVAVEQPDWAEFTEFDWLNPELLKGRIELGGEKLLVYAEMEPDFKAPAAAAGAAGAAGGKGRAATPTQAAPKYPAGPLGGLPLKPGIRVAAVEEATKIPRYLQLGENIQIYAFGKPQQTKLELPAKITSLVAKPPPPPEGAKPVSLIP
jgi:hypothetical protein